MAAFSNYLEERLTSVKELDPAKVEARMDQSSNWTFKAVIEIGEMCDIPDCDDPVEAVLILVDSTEPDIETAFRVCKLHLAETWIDRSEAIADQAQWN